MTALLQPDADPEAAALARAMQPALDELLREVRRSTNYYQSQLADPANSILPAGTTSQTSGPVSRIVITGGSAKMKGLEAYMAARLGVPVEIWNPFENPALDCRPHRAGLRRGKPPLPGHRDRAGAERADPPPARRAEKAAAPARFRNPLAKAA